MSKVALMIALLSALAAQSSGHDAAPLPECPAYATKPCAFETKVLMTGDVVVFVNPPGDDLLCCLPKVADERDGKKKWRAVMAKRGLKKFVTCSSPSYWSHHPAWLESLKGMDSHFYVMNPKYDRDADPRCCLDCYRYMVDTETKRITRCCPDDPREVTDYCAPGGGCILRKPSQKVLAARDGVACCAHAPIREVRYKVVDGELVEDTEPTPTPIACEILPSGRAICPGDPYADEARN